MSQVRLNAFLQMVLAIHSKFTESRSSLKALLTVMRQQVATNNFNLNLLKPGIATARKDKRGAKYETALQYVERTWGKPSLEYKGPNQPGFSDLTGRIHVLKTTQVTFREVDTGTQQNHTFTVNSASNDAAGETTVNLTFGTKSYPVKAVVFELQPAVTFIDVFAGHSPNNLGVNEPVKLGFNSVPANITAAEAGNPMWAIQGAIPGNADTARQLFGKLQRAGNDTSAPLNNGLAYFIAPWATDAAFPTGTRPGHRSSVSTLRLTIQSGPSKDLYVEQTFTVHTPVARMVARAPFRHVHGKPSAGFIGDIYFDPKDVSFHFIVFKEGRGTMVTKQTGWIGPQVMSFSAQPRQLPQSPSGYFASETGRVHQHTGIWVSIGVGDATNGCKLTGSDDVYSGWNQDWPNPYPATRGPLLAGKATNVPSVGYWPIYWKYRATDLAADVTAQQVEHRATMDATGKVTMEKAGASVSKIVSDADVA